MNIKNFEVSELSIEKSTSLKSKPVRVSSFVGFTDHMLEIDYDAAKGGWGKPKIRPFGPLSLVNFDRKKSTNYKF